MLVFAEESITHTEGLLEYTFKDKILIASALNASGNALIYHGDRVTTNKRLAVYGDANMTVHFCTSWYAAGLAQSKRSSYAPLMRLDIINQNLTGVWAEIPSQALSGKNLGRVGKDAGLAEAVATQAGTMGVSDGMMATIL